MTTRRRLERVAALELLERLLEAGLKVDVDRPRLVLRPADRLDPALREEAARLKPVLLELLDPAPPAGPCPACGGAAFGRRPLGRWTCLACGDLAPGAAAGLFFGPDRWTEDARNGVQTSTTRRGGSPVE